MDLIDGLVGETIPYHTNIGVLVNGDERTSRDGGILRSEEVCSLDMNSLLLSGSENSISKGTNHKAHKRISDTVFAFHSHAVDWS